MLIPAPDYPDDARYDNKEAEELRTWAVIVATEYEYEYTECHDEHRKRYGSDVHTKTITGPGGVWWQWIPIQSS